jgi:hypothetical protein
LTSTTPSISPSFDIQSNLIPPSNTPTFTGPYDITDNIINALLKNDSISLITNLKNNPNYLNNIMIPTNQSLPNAYNKTILPSLSKSSGEYGDEQTTIAALFGGFVGLYPKVIDGSDSQTHVAAILGYLMSIYYK